MSHTPFISEAYLWIQHPYQRDTKLDLYCSATNERTSKRSLAAKMTQLQIEEIEVVKFCCHAARDNLDVR